MKPLNELVAVLTISLVLLAPVCWSQGAIMMGVPEFFPGEPSAGLSEIIPQSFDEMALIMGDVDPWQGEDIPGLNGVFKPDTSEDEWTYPWAGKAESVSTGEELLPPSEPTIWEKARKAVEDLLAYLRPREVPENEMDIRPESRTDPVREALGEEEKDTARADDPWLEDSDDEKERAAFNQREVEHFLERQREKEGRSFFTTGKEEGGNLNDLATPALRSEKTDKSAWAPDTSMVYDQSLPGMVFLPDETPAAKRARTDDGQKEGGSGSEHTDSQNGEGATPSAPPPTGATATSQAPPSYDDVITGRVPAGRPTMVFRTGRLVQVNTLPLATDVTQVYEMTPGAEQLPNPAEAFPPSTQKVEGLGERQEAILRATAELEIPVGLVNRFAGLREYHLDIIVDDSGSMSAQDTGLSYSSGGWPQLSRMEELKNRLRAMSRLLSLVADKGISFRKLSNYDHPECISGNQSPESIELQLRQAIDQLYPSSSTPLNSAVRRSFEEAQQKGRQTIAYVFTDGEPTDNALFETPEQSFKNTIQTIREQARPEFYPIALMACTDKEECIRWMNELDVRVRNVQVMDDYFSEKKEVYDHHGGFLPYTLGMYITAGLLGPIDQVLDNLDESRIYEKWQVEDLMGYAISQQQYRDYRFQAQLAWEDRERRARSWAAGQHPLDAINRRPLEVNRLKVFRVVDGYVQPDYEVDHSVTSTDQTVRAQDDLREPDPCPSCTIL